MIEKAGRTRLRLCTLLAATDHCKTCSGMTFAQHQCSKLMSRDMGLIGLPRYLPLAQFTKARPVDSFGPFSLASLETGFVMATRLPATRGCTAHTNKQTDRRTRVPAGHVESPGPRGPPERGVTPRLLQMGLPGVPEDRSPTEPS